MILVSFSGTQKPYLAYNILRIRVADEDLVMEQPLYEEMLRTRDNAMDSWERQRSGYRNTDINQKVFQSQLKRARKVGRISLDYETPATVLGKLELCDGEWLLNTGAALFVDFGMNELQMDEFASNERMTFTDIRRNPLITRTRYYSKDM